MRAYEIKWLIPVSYLLVKITFTAIGNKRGHAERTNLQVKTFEISSRMVMLPSICIRPGDKASNAFNDTNLVVMSIVYPMTHTYLEKKLINFL